MRKLFYNRLIVVHKGGLTYCITDSSSNASEITGVSVSKIERMLDQNVKKSFGIKEGIYTKDAYFEFYYLDNFPEEQIYKNGGGIEGDHTTYACIEQVVKSFDQVSSIKDHFVADKKLVIVFDHELRIEDIEVMQRLLDGMPECHSVMDDVRIGNYGGNYKSVSIDIKTEVADTFKHGGDIMGKTMHEFKSGELHSSSGDVVKNRKQAIAIGLSKQRSGKFSKGGEVPSQLTDFPNQIETWNGIFYKSLVTTDFTFYSNFEEGDDNANTIMYRNDGSLVSDNYFANEGLMEQLQDEDEQYIFIHKNLYDYLEEYRNN